MWITSFCFVLSVLANEKPDKGFEIISHIAKIHILPSSTTLRCSDTLIVRRTKEDIENIELNLLPLYTIEAVNIEGRKADFDHARGIVKINDISSDSLFQVVVQYSCKQYFQSEFSQFNRERAILRSEELLPYGPSALQTVRLTFIVPPDWETIALGRLITKNTTTDSSMFVWEFDQPISTLGWFCAGKFWKKEIQDIEHTLSAYLFDEDSGAAAGVLSLAKDILQFYSEKFSPYRFPKLDIVEVEDWVAGKNVLAIASPSFIMVKKQAFTTSDKFNQVQSILAHEIAHQWWSYTIFVNDSDAAFLSEGMCEYSAHLYNEAHGTMSSRDSLNRHPLLRPLLMKIQQGKDVPLRQKADLRSLQTHYLKAAYVHNMLRRILGDSLFLQLYYRYSQRFSLKHVELADFQKLAEELYGGKLGWFFDQWVAKAGVPRLKIYNVKSTLKDGEWITRGRVRIVGYDKFTINCRLSVQTEKESYWKEISLGADSSGNYRNDVPFEIITNDKPLRAALDPNGELLKIQKLPPKLGDLRDPSYGLMIIGTLKNYDHLIKLAQKDSAEMDKGGWSIAMKFDTSITLTDLQNERVFLYGRREENRVVADFENKFPLNFIEDSVEIKGERIFDRNLTLVQVIDNPFIAQGIITWVAPMSENANEELLPYDASWILLKGKDEISSGTWDVKDEDLVVEIK